MQWISLSCRRPHLFGELLSQSTEYMYLTLPSISSVSDSHHPGVLGMCMCVGLCSRKYCTAQSFFMITSCTVPLAYLEKLQKEIDPLVDQGIIAHMDIANLCLFEKVLSGVGYTAILAIQCLHQPCNSIHWLLQCQIWGADKAATQGLCR